MKISIRTIPKEIRRETLRLSSLVMATAAFICGRVEAGTFTNNFDSGVIIPGTTLFGSATDPTAYDHSTGGVNNSGTLKLTVAVGSQNSWFILDDLDNGAAVGAFDASWQMLLGGGNGADGLSFNFGNFGDGSIAEEGTSSGLSICFDTYNNGGVIAEAPAIDLKWNGVVIAHKLIPPAIGALATVGLHNTFWPVKVHVDTDGTLDLVYNNVIVYTNFPVYQPVTGGRFAFGARTGGVNDNAWVDNLSITTTPTTSVSGQPALINVTPVGLLNPTTGGNGSAVGGVMVQFTNTTYSIDPATLKLVYNTTTVTPTNGLAVTTQNGVTTLVYRGANGLLPTGAATVTLSYSSTSTPPVPFSYAWAFTIDTFTTIPASYAIASVDTNQPGFRYRVIQMDSSVVIRAPGDRNLLINAERELANGYIDSSTGLPYFNLADLSTATNGWFIEPGVINFNYSGEIGNFQDTSTPSRPDEPFPGIGAFGSTDNFTVEFQTILKLKAGGYRFGVNSDDGFRVSFAPGWDAAGGFIAGNFNGGRGSSDSVFDVVVAQDGFYPVRISYWQGTGGANIEFFTVDPLTNTKILINDPDLPSPRAYRASAVSRPYVSRTLPVQNWVGAFPNDDVVVEVTDGSIPVDSNSLILKINGAAQTVTTAKAIGKTTITRQSSIDKLLPSGNNTVTLIYSFTENGNPVTLTNSWSFTVAPYYNMVPPAYKVSPGDIVTGETGFHARVNQMDRTHDANTGNGGRITGGGDANRMPRPEMQLVGGFINPTNNLPYPNLAVPGPDPDGGYDLDFINFNHNTASPFNPADAGLFTAAAPNFPLPGAMADAGAPGLPGGGTSEGGLENYVMEATTYLNLKRGVYVFGINSDDGFVVSTAPDPHDTLGTLLGFANVGRGNSGNLAGPTGGNPPLITPGTSTATTPFGVIVPEDGIYPMRVLYWQGGGGVNAEFFQLNKDNGQVLLINDTSVPWGIQAYRHYTGAARPWVEFSVAPTPWDNRVQQAAPGPITLVGRTAANVQANDIVNDSDARRPWADIAIGGVFANAGNSSIGMLLDGNPVTPTITQSGTNTVVSYRPNPPLGSNTTHTASLVYGGGTNSWTFTVQPYVSVSDTNALPLTAADPNSRGFTARIVQIRGDAPAPANATTVARAESQLAGTLIDPATTKAFVDLSTKGPGPNGSYILTNILN